MSEIVAIDPRISGRTDHLMTLKKTTQVLLWGANIWYFGEGMLGPLYVIFAEKVGGDLLDITWAWSTYLICTGVCYIAFGKLFNRRRNKARLLVTGYLLNAALTFGYLWVDSPARLFVVQVGLGITEAIATPLWDAMYAASLCDEHDTYAWGLSTGQSQIVSGVAFGLGGVLVHLYSFAALFIAMGVIQLAAAAVTARLLAQRTPVVMR